MKHDESAPPDARKKNRHANVSNNSVEFAAASGEGLQYVQRNVDLSPREHKVLQCLANGLSIKITAQNLGISFNTADTYVRRIYSKLGVHTRAAAVTWFCKHTP